MRIRRTRLAAAAAVVASLTSPPPAAHARVCITVTVYQAGQPTTHGPFCQPLLDEQPEQCLGPGEAHEGYGLSAQLCAPSA